MHTGVVTQSNRPDTDPYAGWCGRGGRGRETPPYPDQSATSNGKTVGISHYPAYTSNTAQWISLALLDKKAAEPGIEVSIVWGEPDGGSAKPSVERRIQTEIKATVEPCPISVSARETCTTYRARRYTATKWETQMVIRRHLLAMTAAAIGALGVASAHAASPAEEGGKPAFVLVHGAWHGSWTWDDVVPLLLAEGYPVHAIELPGAGTKALYPAAYLADPSDAAGMATQPSGTEAVTQAARTEYTIEAVKAAAATAPNGKVVLVGHSLGGLTITPVTEAASDMVQDVVYLTAFLATFGLPGGAILENESFAATQINSLFVANPADTGTLRLNPRSADEAYFAQARETFYGDISEERVKSIVAMLHTDEPASVMGTVSEVTAENFGSVDRHYIVMEDDNTIPVAAQDFMIEQTDASGELGKTTVHRMEGSHSPFFAQPQALADVLVKIAKGE